VPTKNTIKTYIENGYYHIYSRGVDKREIFLDQQDCAIFLYYLKIYLSNPEDLSKELTSPKILFKITNLNLSKEIDLLSFALMPNHFHLQLKQYTVNGIEKLTRRALTGYVQYFNKKYKRVGTLFESTYKAILVQTETQHLYLSSYIHRNPMKLVNPKMDFIQFSSYPYYRGEKNASWIKPQEILSFFKKTYDKSELLSYTNFVESFKENPSQVLENLTLEEDTP